MKNNMNIPNVMSGPQLPHQLRNQILELMAEVIVKSRIDPEEHHNS